MAEGAETEEERAEEDVTEEEPGVPNQARARPPPGACAGAEDEHALAVAQPSDDHTSKRKLLLSLLTQATAVCTADPQSVSQIVKKNTSQMSNQSRSRWRQAFEPGRDLVARVVGSSGRGSGTIATARWRWRGSVSSPSARVVPAASSSEFVVPSLAASFPP